MAVHLSPRTWTAHVPTLHTVAAQPWHPEPPLPQPAAFPTAANSLLCPQHSPLIFKTHLCGHYRHPQLLGAGAGAGPQLLLVGVNPAGTLERCQTLCGVCRGYERVKKRPSEQPQTEHFVCRSLVSLQSLLGAIPEALLPGPLLLYCENGSGGYRAGMTE